MARMSAPALRRVSHRQAVDLPADRRRRVVIIGGGFAGLFAARALGGAPVSVTLVDRTSHHLFQPLLYQLATGVVSEGQIAVPLRGILRRHRNVDCVLADMTGLDVQDRKVLARRPGGGRLAIPYDELIVALGVRQSYFGNDDFATYAPGMKTLSDALVIRRRVFGAFEMAQTAADETERRRWLTFALVGAGPTGVELAGQIRELATLTLRDQFRSIDPEDARVLLFDGGEEPLAPFGHRLAARAGRSLTSLGVELHMRTVVTEVDSRGLGVKGPDGATTRYDAATVLWTAGVEAPPVATKIAQACGAEQDHAGRILVEPDLTLRGHPEISVVGDLMHRDRLPGVAEVAMQSGYYAARRIRHRLEHPNEPFKPFRYHDFGSAAYISRGDAVMSVGPVHVGGRLGWLAWLCIHIAFLTGFRNRAGAVLSWAISFARESRRERAFVMGQLPHKDIYTQSVEPPER